MDEKDLREVLFNFALPGKFSGAWPLGQGHINDTYLVEVNHNNRVEQYTFQRINTYVFRQPELMMINFEKITRHLREKIYQLTGKEPDRQALRLVPSRTGQSFYRTPRGEYWRVYHYISGCHTIEIATCPEQAFQAGQAFGRFQRLVFDLPPEEIHETIPYFHHTPRRFRRFLEVLEDAPAERKRAAAQAITFALERHSITSVITDGLESGRLPLRITHNDTKINNVLFDDETGEAVCVIDLDTTMPGSPLYDFGDMVRTSTCQAAEDETDLSLVVVDLAMFQALAEGYLSETANLLTPAEIDLLVFAGRLITYTIGLRFLTDYLEGDVYFKTSRPDHNLDRTLVQFRLLRSMEEREKDMLRVIRSLL